MDKHRRVCTASQGTNVTAAGRATGHKIVTTGGDGSAINVGTGRETRVRALAEIIVGVAGSGSTIAHAAARAGEIVRSLAVVDKARAELDFVAATALRDGLAATLAP